MKNNWPIKKLLITGVPGMGKTTFGNYLSRTHGYNHVDMESSGYISVIMANPNSFIESLVNSNNHTAVTWGFVPSDEQITVVNLFKKNGFKIIWFDGNRNAARREFMKRDQQKGTEYLNASLNTLNLQMERIENSGVVNRIKPIIINTFNEDGSFKELNDIHYEIENV